MANSMPHSKGMDPQFLGFLHYQWRQPVYYLDCDQSFPASTERPGYFLGPAAVTNQEIFRSVVRAEDNPAQPNSLTLLNVPGITIRGEVWTPFRRI